MDYTSLSSRAKLLIISGSLLIHLLLLLLLFIAITGENPFESSRHLDQLATILAQSPHETEDATVIFYDEPSQHMSTTTGTEPISSQTDVSFDPYAKKAIDTEKKEVAVKEEVHDENREAMQDTPLPTQVATTAELLDTLQIERNERDATIQEEQQQPEKKVAAHSPTQQQKPGTPATSGIGNITLAEITKGFLKNMAQESGGKPTSLNAEELARQRYGTRVWSLLRQSYNAYKSPTQLLNDIHTHAVFVLTIDKTGKIVSAELRHPKKSLDIIQIERSLLQAVYKAGLFPPIPKQFNVETITLSYPLGIRGHEGTHMYDLIYE